MGELEWKAYQADWYEASRQIEQLSENKTQITKEMVFESSEKEAKLIFPRRR